jgi:hypothetical protein
LVAGISFKPTDKVFIATEIEKDLEYDPIWKMGLEYKFHEKFCARTGYNLNPNAAFFGLGFKTKKFAIDYALATQYILKPQSPGFCSLPLQQPMIRRLTILFIVLSASHTLAAQDYPRKEVDLEILADQLFGFQDLDLNYQELYENMALLLSNPVNVNKASAEELRFLNLLSEYQVQNPDPIPTGEWRIFIRV